jgi:hypothetical protein
MTREGLAAEIESLLGRLDAADKQKRWRDADHVHALIVGWVSEHRDAILSALRAEPSEQEVERAYRAGWKEGYEQCPAIEGLSFGAMYEDECWAEYRAARSRP